MAINGMHTLLYTTDPVALRAVLRDAFGFKHLDAGGGWLIFTMPPSEMGVHPTEGPSSEAGTRHLISFMCDDINRTVADLVAKGVDVDTSTNDEGYGITTMMRLPGGCEVMLYEPRHPIAADIKRASPTRSTRAVKKIVPKKKAAKKAAKKKAGR